jgi:hypothetical protein
MQIRTLPSVRGDEARVEEAFRSWLAREGWEVGDPPPELQFLDVLARRGDRLLYAEVKGRTAAIGIDVDTAYGQLLRRMPAFEDERVRYALVVPDRAEAAALRVPRRARDVLRIAIYVVDEQGEVRESDP